MTDIVKANENLFLALGFPPYEAEVLQLRAELMARLKGWFDASGLTQAEAADRLGITQARVSDLMRGHWQKFSVEMLLTLAIKAGIHVRIAFEQAA
jgi:predicted XRE-type DNA-binding protein